MSHLPEINPLLYWRAKRGLTIKELAERSGVHHMTISLLERDERRAEAHILGKLANALEIDWRELIALKSDSELNKSTRRGRPSKKLAKAS